MVRQAIGIIIVSLALAYNGAVSAENVAKTPDYPLFAVSIERSYSRAELDKIAVWFAATHGALSADQVTYLKEKRPDFKVLVHINSTYTMGPVAPYVETNLREAIAMHHTANLAEALDMKARTFQLLPVGKKQIVLKASTIAGDISASDEGTKRYVTWIQIDDEYMRIEDWDTASSRITVTRGFAGTSSNRHAVGAVVLSPVYIGVKGSRWTGYYPGGPARYLRYALRNDH